MDAVKFLEEAKRMCNYTGDCKGCPLETEKNSANCILWATPNAIDNPGEIVSKVEKWAAEHPVKTRQSEFLRMFPNADIDKDGVLIAIPCHIDKNMKKVYCQALNGCVECRKAYWLAEVE